MPDEKRQEAAAALVVMALMILTAWGNAWAMLVFSAAALLAGFLLFRKDLSRGAILVAVAAAALGLVIALAVLVTGR